MKKTICGGLIPGLLILLAGLVAAPQTWAQSGKITLPAELQGLVGGGSNPADNLKIKAEIQLSPNDSLGLLRITAVLGPHWHIYSVTQEDGGPLRTEIQVEETADFELVGPFEAIEKPKVRRLEFYDVPVEEHYESVTWTAPIMVKSGVQPDALSIRGEVNGQICEDQAGCVPLSSLDTTFVAQVVGQVKDPAALAERVKRRTPPIENEAVAAGAAVTPSPIPADTAFRAAPTSGYRAERVHAVIRGRVEFVDGELVLVVTAVPDEDWHVYAYAAKDPVAISKPTLVAVAEPAGWSLGAPEVSDKPIEKLVGLPMEPVQRYHESTVTWRFPLLPPGGKVTGTPELRGLIGYQTCSDDRCDPPAGVYFSATIDEASREAVPLKFAEASYSDVAKFLAGVLEQGSASTPLPPATDSSVASDDVDYDLTKIEVVEASAESASYIVLVAFIGGFLLNFMPCVLPVIGLKIMSFVQQAGEHRSRVFTLNLVYSLGMLSVFWLLATLASGASLGLSDESLGWGEQFNYAGFTIPLLCVVFVMGLSFIGVWEIPLPGFVGSGAANSLAQKEGLGGAFFKGILTTVLATPCSGPGIATALTWSATQPPSLVYLVFTSMGIGMAFPYLLIGAFPSLVRFIPKPGAWMETFKQLMGFVLMGTVVYMFTLIDQKYVIPTLAMIFGLWAACWWIGKTPITASAVKKLTAWGTATAFASIIAFFAFAYESEKSHELPWEEYSLVALDEHVKAGRTVMIDFTARWCPTCKVLEKYVLNTRPVSQVVEKNDVVTMVADWSDNGEEIGKILEALGSKQLPVIAIFPADDPYRPSMLTGSYTKNDLISKLQAAGPSTTRRLAADTR